VPAGKGRQRKRRQRIKAGQQGVATTLPALVTAQEHYAMTAEGYDYEYALTMTSHDAWGYGTYSSTPTTSRIEVTVDPPPWACASCRKIKGSPDV